MASPLVSSRAAADEAPGRTRETTSGTQGSGSLQRLGRNPEIALEKSLAPTVRVAQ